MKREVVNEVGRQWWKKMQGRFPGEHIKIVRGSALRDMTCDYTGERIHKGEPCACVSVWTDALSEQGKGYYPWETEYIEREDSNVGHQGN